MNIYLYFVVIFNMFYRASKAMQRFPELPAIKKCHDYQINTKYTYKCTDCGYRYLYIVYNSILIRTKALSYFLI